MCLVKYWEIRFMYIIYNIGNNKIGDKGMI
jgi:hypothetical protein